MLLASAVGCLLAYVALATQDASLILDHGTRAWVATVRSEALTLPVRIVTSLGEATGLIPLIGLTVLLAWSARRRWALALPLLMAGAGGLQWAAKWLADRPRPDATPMGFPSGHMLTLIVLLGLIVYLVAARAGRRAWRASACVVCAGTLVAVGFTRLYLDKHWLSDLGGGLAMGLAYLLLAIWLVDVCLPAYAPPRGAEE